MKLDERKLKILRTIIDDYILTATPVGSRAISRHPEISLSSATIRNEMSDLEEMGYLDQPHTSAGRVPSDKAYRLYVDKLMRHADLTGEELKLIQYHVARRINEAEELLTQSAQVLAQLTSYPSVVMAPELKRVKIKHIQLVPISDERAYAVVVTDTDMVCSMHMRIPAGYGAHELEIFSRMLTGELTGKTAREAIHTLENELSVNLKQHRTFFNGIADVLMQDKKQSVLENVVLGGASSIFMHPEFADMRRAQEIINMFEDKSTLYRIMDRATTMNYSVMIGQENPEEEMKGTSVITATYRLGDTPIGSIGVIGPTRMDYARVFAVLQYMSQALSDVFTKGLDDS